MEEDEVEAVWDQRWLLKLVWAGTVDPRSFGFDHLKIKNLFIKTLQFL